MIHLSKNLYFLSIFFVLLPPFYFISPLLSLHRIAGVIWIFLFLFLLLKLKNKEIKLKFDKRLLLLFLFFIFSQSLSIITALNVEAFIEVFENMIAPAILFILSIFLINKEGDLKKLIFILMSVSIVNILMQLLLIFDPNFFFSIANFLLHPEYLNIINFNSFRGRVFIENYDEILIPLIIYFSFIMKPKKKLPVLLLLAIAFVSFLSGFRTKILLVIFAVVSSAFVFRKRFNFLILPFAIIFLFYFLYASLPLLGNYNTVIDRALSGGNDIEAISSGRQEKWGEALEIGKSSPLIGVGLGNYYDYLPAKLQKSFSLFKEKNEQFDTAARDPHNVFFSLFAETGTVGLFAFTLLLLYFLKTDILIIRKGKDLTKSFVISFWTLFIFSTLNPSYSIIYQSLFWILRAAISKAEVVKEVS